MGIKTIIYYYVFLEITPIVLHSQLVQGEVSICEPSLSTRPPTWHEAPAFGGGPALRALPRALVSLHASKSISGTDWHEIRGFLQNRTQIYIPSN